MIRRESYLHQLKTLKDVHLIKVLTGVRRCGKSTMLEMFRDELKTNGIKVKNIIYVNMESGETPDFTTWRDAYEYITRKISGKGMYYVFIDEVGLIPNFERMIDALFVRYDIDLYVTGSNAYLLSSEIATILTGRYIEIQIFPFSFQEYAALTEREPGDRLFREYLSESCFPEAAKLRITSPEQSGKYLHALYDTVVLKDIVQKRHLRQVGYLEQTLGFLFDNIGNLTSANNIADYINSQREKKVSHNTIAKFLEYLSSAYLVYPVNRYNIRGKQRLVTNQKYYVVDLGLRNILQVNHYDTDLGHKLENIVYFELLRRGGQVFVGKHDDNEIDFVVQKDGNMFEYYQVSFTTEKPETLERELRPLQHLRNAYPKFLLTMDYDNTNIDGIKKMNVIDWLLASHS